MDKKILYICSLLVFLGVLFTVWIVINSEAPDHSNVAVYYSRPTPLIKPSPILNSGDPAIGKQKEESQKTPAVIQDAANANAEISSSSAMKKTLYIQDALSEPIDDGYISLGTEFFSFTKGSVLLPDSIAGEIPVSVSAEGYFPASQLIQTATDVAPVIVMEYYCDYTLRVYEADGKTPCPDAVVRLWKTASPVRPVPKIYSVAFDVQLSTWQVELRDDQCFLTRSDPNYHESPITPDGNASHPKSGDQIIAVGNCLWRLGDSLKFANRSYPSKYIDDILEHSCRLRLWDTLGLTRDGEANKSFFMNDFCEIEREGVRGYTPFFFPDLPESLESLQEVKTDSHGSVRFDNLPPALYYAQAQRNSQKSAILPLHPSRRGGNLILADTSQVRIIVKRKNAEKNAIAERAPWGDSSVSLQSTEHTGGVFSSALSSAGVVCFEKVPYGVFRLVASLPGDRFIQSRVEKDVVIDRPQMSIRVEVEDWLRYRVSGMVRNADTQEPVESYPLLLIHDDNFTYLTATSDREGRFTFADVVPGDYRLTVKITDYQNCKFLPLLDNDSAVPFMMKSNFFDNAASAPVQVVNRDIDGIIIPVKQIVETSFAGQVTYPGGNSAAGVSMTASVSTPDFVVAMKDVQTIPSDVKTDGNGSFNFSIIKNNQFDLSSCEFEISAMEGQWSPAQWIKSDEDSFSLKKEQFIPLRTGSIVVNGKPGDRFENLSIVLKNEKKNTVYGRLIAVEESYESVELSAFQNSLELCIQKNADGSFRIENVAQGSFELTINPHFSDVMKTPYGIQERSKYLPEKINLVMPEDKQEIYVDIQLRNSGYIWGTVKDSQGIPARNIAVDVRDYSDASRPAGQTYIDDQGFFFMGHCSLVPGKRYRLQCIDLQSNQIVLTLNTIIPPVDNLEIRLLCWFSVKWNNRPVELDSRNCSF